MLDFIDTNKKKEWKALWENKAYLGIWLTLLVVALGVLKLLSVFLVFNEARGNAIQIDDWVLTHLSPTNVSVPLFAITWICIFICLPFALRTPSKSITVLVSVILISILRCVSMYFVPLEAPIGIIPLRDFLLEGTFYDNQVLVKDLFFSGHTANLALLSFLIDIKWMKIALAIATAIVAFLLLKQHVHYTIDVVAAPFFAYLAYSLGILVTAKIFSFMECSEEIESNFKAPVV